jgi:hypothetical protein
VYDRVTGQTECVSVPGSRTGVDALHPSIPVDGRYVSFVTGFSLVPEDTNWVVDVYVHDRMTGQYDLVSVTSDGTQGNGHSRFFSSISLRNRLEFGQPNGQLSRNPDTNAGFGPIPCLWDQSADLHWSQLSDV